MHGHETVQHIRSALNVKCRVFDPQRSKDVLVKVIAELESADFFNDTTNEVNADAVVPRCSGFLDKGHGQRRPVELVQPMLLDPVIELVGVPVIAVACMGW